MKTIGSKIKEIRKEKDMTQDDLARKADIPYATLMKIESGSVKNPTVNTMQKIAGALKVSIDTLVNNSNKNNKNE